MTDESGHAWHYNTRSGVAHVFREQSSRARCGVSSQNGSWWEPAQKKDPHCTVCRRIIKHKWDVEPL